MPLHSFPRERHFLTGGIFVNFKRGCYSGTWRIMLATSWDAIYFNKRGFNMRGTWLILLATS
jgi:hypothetical protein